MAKTNDTANPATSGHGTTVLGSEITAAMTMLEQKAKTIKGMPTR